jgi:hypothetical protein
VWHRPLCSLFAWRNATDFAGTCEHLPPTCLEKKWCAAHCLIVARLLML